VNPLAFHFLPSVIRGVYRFDDELSTVTDDEDYQAFIRRKLRFLPRNIEQEIRQQTSFESDSWSTPIPLTRTTAASSRRAAAFFQQHSYFNNAVMDGKLATDSQLKDAQNFLEIQFVRKILAPLLTDAGLENVYPQWEVGRYRLDFALISGSRKFALETDGFGKFKERKDLDDFVRRQNFIAKEGWTIIRYSYGQVMETTDATLQELYGFLQDEPQMRGLLAIDSPPHNPYLPGFEPSETGQNVVHLVNDFHRVQDHFTDLMLSEMPESSPIILSDCFGLTFPFVAMAVSALFDFLTAVAEVVDIDFDLPRITVSGVRPPRNWGICLHPYVSVLDGTDAAGVALDGPTVQRSAHKLPAPPSTAGHIKFRANLSVDYDIHKRLLYFTDNLFGYPNGTQDFQDRVLQRVFNGSDVLGIAATGSGKSFCFWLPALLKPGLTLIIAPLRSLMRDQRLTLLNYGIASAEFINSDNTMSQRRILEEIKLGYVRLLYVSPERLRIKKFLDELTRLQEFVPINFLAIDEAHCISEWGHDFRPSYLKLPYLHKTLTAKLIALTATAGQQVEADILGILNLSKDQLERARHLDRERFSFQVAVKDGPTKTQAFHEILTKDLPVALGHGQGQERLRELLANKNRHGEKALGIIFCIYADPHGKHSILDGTAHYLFETMTILEPGALFEGRGKKKFRLDAFSTGKVRAFSSKPPTLCHECHSYAYTSKAGLAAEPDELSDDDGADPVRFSNQRSKGKVAGVKVCSHCKREFDAEKAITPPGWEESLKSNQVDFKKGGFDILVATKGFGMGIDKGSVRFVVHTSLSSGLESWYQEVGRAGRDNERAHIVLLCEPPHPDCSRKLFDFDRKSQNVPRPDCNYRAGCSFGKPNLCDYGKQHMFISSSYPGAEADAMSALGVLDKLIASWIDRQEDSVGVYASHAHVSRKEIALYRLMVLGLITDYVITYGRTPRFDVSLVGAELTDKASLSRLEGKFSARLADYFANISGSRQESMSQRMARCRQDYRPLESFAQKLDAFQAYGQAPALFHSVYEHLLLLLDHTYSTVLKMRYTMLQNLLSVVADGKCRRINMLSHLGDESFLKPAESYRCGMCDICAPDLVFPEQRMEPAISSPTEKDRQMENALAEDIFDLETLRGIVDYFRDYPTATYRRARSILEGNPNNMVALYLSREFSPSAELAGNAKRLLLSANQRRLPLPDIADLYHTSPKNLESELLLLLNDPGSACDSIEGWRFLADEAARPEHRQSGEVRMMGECLEFFHFVESAAAQESYSLKDKARRLAEAFRA